MPIETKTINTPEHNADFPSFNLWILSSSYRPADDCRPTEEFAKMVREMSS